jgi:hypothetical protein
VWGADIRIGWTVALPALGMSFTLSCLLAWVYRATYQGMSYQRAFVQTLALGGPVAAMALLAIGDDLARGLGLVGSLTLIRFRATLKDTRDLVFAFATLACGVACGVASFSIASMGALVFAMAAMVIYGTGFGTRTVYEAVLRLRAGYDESSQATVNQLLGRHCRGFALVLMRDVDGKQQEQSYQLRLTDRRAGAVLLRELEAVPGLEAPALYMQEAVIDI